VWSVSAIFCTAVTMRARLVLAGALCVLADKGGAKPPSCDAEKAQVKKLTGQVESLTAEKSSLKTEVEGHKKTEADTSAKAADLSKQVDKLQAELEQKKAAVTAAEAEAAKAKEAAAAGQAQADSGSKDLQKQIDALKSEAAAAKQKAAEAEKEVQGLKTKLKSAQDDASTCSGKLQETAKSVEACSESAASARAFSVFGVVSSATGVTTGLVNHILDQTTVDDQVSEAFKQGYSLAVEQVEAVQAVDYAGHIEQLRKHELYTLYVAPHVATVSEISEPYMKQYVTPAVDSVSKQYSELFPVVNDSVIKVVSQAMDTVNTVPDHVATARSAAGSYVSPVVEFVKKAAPQHAHIWPTDPADVLLLSLIVLIVNLVVLFLGYKIFRVGFKVTKTVLTPPAKLTVWGLSTYLYFATLFYCCGRCRRRSGDAGAKSAKADTKPAPKNQAAATKPDKKKKK